MDRGGGVDKILSAFLLSAMNLVKGGISPNLISKRTPEPRRLL